MSVENHRKSAIKIQRLVLEEESPVDREKHSGEEGVESHLVETVPSKKKRSHFFVGRGQRLVGENWEAPEPGGREPGR